MRRLDRDLAALEDDLAAVGRWTPTSDLTSVLSRRRCRRPARPPCRVDREVRAAQRVHAAEALDDLASLEHPLGHQLTSVAWTSGWATAGRRRGRRSARRRGRRRRCRRHLERAEPLGLDGCAASPSAQPPATTSRRCGPAIAAMRSRISAPPRPASSSASPVLAAGSPAPPVPAPRGRRRAARRPRSTSGRTTARRAGTGGRARRASRRSCPRATVSATLSRESGAIARMNASAVPQESSTSPSPTAPAPTAALRWSWPPTASTAPRAAGSSGAVTSPAGVPATAGSGRKSSGAPAQSRASRHRPAIVEVQPAGAAGERELGGLLAAEARTTHSATLSQRTPARAAGSWSRSQRSLASEHSSVGGRPVVAANRSPARGDPLRLVLAAAVVPGDRRGAGGRPWRSSRIAGLRHARTPTAATGAPAAANASRRPRRGRVEQRLGRRSRRRSARSSTASARARGRARCRRGRSRPPW